MADEKSESNLVEHARHELELIEEDPKTIEGYIRVVKAFSNMGHSGVSASIAIPVILDLLSFKNLSPLTDDPNEWMRHTPDRWDGENHIWQNVRRGEAFSTDGGKTYYLLSEGVRDRFTDALVYPTHTSEKSRYIEEKSDPTLD